MLVERVTLPPPVMCPAMSSLTQILLTAARSSPAARPLWPCLLPRHAATCHLSATVPEHLLTSLMLSHPNPNLTTAVIINTVIINLPSDEMTTPHHLTRPTPPATSTITWYRAPLPVRPAHAWGRRVLQSRAPQCILMKKKSRTRSASSGPHIPSTRVPFLLA
jgi:hypothetical protein